MRIGGPVTAEQHVLLPLSVQFLADPDHLPQQQTTPDNRSRVVDRIDAFLFPACVTLTLVNTATGEQVTVEPHDPTSGMPVRDLGDTFIKLGVQPGVAVAVEFPLLSAGDAMKPGSYDCTVNYDSSRRRPEWTAGGPPAVEEFWSGQVSSAPLRIEIVAETPKKSEFILPKRLHLSTDHQVVFGADDAEHIKLPVRNGYFTGMRITRENGPETLTNAGFSGTDATVEDLKGDPGLAGGKALPKLSYTIEIFETAEPAKHFWMPVSGANGYQTLWKQVFEVSADPTAH